MDYATRAKGEAAERDRICKCGEPRKHHRLRCRVKACGGHVTLTGATGALECAYCGGAAEVVSAKMFGEEVFCFGFRGTEEFLTERSAGEAAALDVERGRS